jgi:hypothetical protein
MEDEGEEHRKQADHQENIMLEKNTISPINDE